MTFIEQEKDGDAQVQLEAPGTVVVEDDSSVVNELAAVELGETADRTDVANEVAIETKVSKLLGGSPQESAVQAFQCLTDNQPWIPFAS